MKLIFALALAVVVLMVAEAHRGPKGGRGGDRGPKGGPFHGGRKGRFNDDDDKYKFTVITSDNEEVNEYAVAANNTRIVKVFSKGNNSSISGSATLYDNTNETGILIILSWGYPCIVADTSRTHEQNVDDIEALNGTTASANSKTTLLVNGSSVGKDERTRLFESNPLLRRVCGRKPINQATPYDNTQEAPANTTELNIVSFLNEITILVPEEVARRGGPKSQGGFSSSSLDSSSEERRKPPRDGQNFGPKGGRPNFGPKGGRRGGPRN